MTPWDQVFWQIIWPPAIALALGGAGITYARWISRQAAQQPARPKTVLSGRMPVGKQRVSRTP